MKRNNLIAMAVAAIMGAALSTAYADDEFAPVPANQQANQQAPDAGAAQAGGQQWNDQAGHRYGDHRYGDDRHDAHDVSGERRDIGRDRADIRSDGRDIQRDRADLRAGLTFPQADKKTRAGRGGTARVTNGLGTWRPMHQCRTDEGSVPPGLIPEAKPSDVFYRARRPSQANSRIRKQPHVN
jgi:hypothetical protein